MAVARVQITDLLLGFPSGKYAVKYASSQCKCLVLLLYELIKIGTHCDVNVCHSSNDPYHLRSNKSVFLILFLIFSKEPVEPPSNFAIPLYTEISIVESWGTERATAPCINPRVRRSSWKIFTE